MHTLSDSDWGLLDDLLTEFVSHYDSQAISNTLHALTKASFEWRDLSGSLQDAFIDIISRRSSAFSDDTLQSVVTSLERMHVKWKYLQGCRHALLDALIKQLESLGLHKAVHIMDVLSNEIPAEHFDKFLQKGLIPLLIKYERHLDANNLALVLYKFKISKVIWSDLVGCRSLLQDAFLIVLLTLNVEIW